MKTKFAVALLFMLSVFYTASAQEASIEWSESIKYIGNKTPFLQNIVGDTDDLIFVSGVYQPEHIGYIPQSKKDKFQYTLISFDKKTLRIVNQLEVRAFKDKEHEDLWHIETVVINGRIFIFWQKSDKTSIEVFYESFDLSLNRIQPLTSILKQNHLGPKNPKSEAFAFADKNRSSKIIVGIKLPVKRLLDFRGSYRIINEDFSISNETSTAIGRSMTPLNANPTSQELEELKSSSQTKFHFLDNNTLYLTNGSTLNLTTNSAEKIKSPLDKDFVHSGKYFTTPNGIGRIGFYETNSKLIVRDTLKGVFFSELNLDSSKTYSIYSLLPQKIIQEFDSISPNERSLYFGIDSISKPSERFEGMAYCLKIEKVIQEPEGTIIFFADNDDVFSNHIPDSYSTRFYKFSEYSSCKIYRKRKVFILALDSNLNYRWHTTIHRTKIFIERDVPDINVKVLENGYFVVFGNDIIESTHPKKVDELKTMKERTDEIEYAFITRDGKVDQKKLNINANRTSDQEEKEIHPAQAFYTLDNELYILGNREIGRLIVR